jgi:hypothetical protein
MGKATILGSGALGLGRGQYRVRIEKADNRTASEILRIDNELAAISSSLSDLYSSYSDARKAYDNARSDLSRIIQQSKESPAVDYSDKLSSATQSELDASISHSVARNRYQSARLKQRSLEGKKSYLNDRTTEDIRTVWCADCQRNLSGSVATIEIPNTDDTILIRPGGADGSGSVYSSTRDGQLRSVHAMSPAEAAWNFTMFPAWQKWKPLYRMGKILERIPNNSKCTVLLDAYSTAQGLDTDVERRLTNVPMIYKGRDDGGPYQVGDRVVVEFYNQNPEAPRVVGFEDYPCTTTTTTTISVCTSSSSSSSMTTTTVTLPPGLVHMLYSGVGPDRNMRLTFFNGWTSEIIRTLTGTIPSTSRWYGMCLCPLGIVARGGNILYQFEGFTTNLLSTIGYSPGWALSYDSSTGNLLSSQISGSSGLSIHDGISPTISSNIMITHPDSFYGYVDIESVCVYKGDLILVVSYYSKTLSRSVAYLWRMVGYSNTIKTVIRSYPFPFIGDLGFIYDGDYVEYRYGGRTDNFAAKYNGISPAGIQYTHLPLHQAGGLLYNDLSF